MNDKTNVINNEGLKSVTTATAVVNRPNKRKDVFVLILLLFFVGAVLVGLTAAFPEKALFQASAENTAEPVTSSTSTFDENGNPIYEDGQDPFAGSVFENHTAVEQDAQGNTIITYADGSKATYAKGGAVGGTIQEVNLDDIFGTAPASTDQAVENALNSANAITYSTKAHYTYDTYYSVVSDGSGSSGAHSLSSGGSSTNTAFYTVQFTGGTWYYFITNMAGNITASGSSGGSVGTTGNVSGSGSGSRGWATSGTTTSVSSSASSSKKYYTFYYTGTGSCSDGKNDSGSYTVYVSSCSLSLKHSYNPDLSSNTYFSLSCTAYSWAESRSVTSKASTTGGIYSHYLSYMASASSTALTDADGNGVFVYSTSSSVTQTTQGGQISAYFQTYTNKSYTKYLSAADMMIDKGSPTLTSAYIVDGEDSTTAVTTHTNSTNLHLLVVCKDNPGTGGAASGISKVTITNTTNGWSTSKSWTATGAGAQNIYVPITTGYANGTWTIKLDDHVSSHTAIFTEYNDGEEYCFNWYDGNAPTIVNSLITFDVTGTATTVGTEKWTRDALTISLTVNDTADSKGTAYNEIASVNVSFSVNGNYYTIGDFEALSTQDGTGVTAPEKKTNKNPVNQDVDAKNDAYYEKTYKYDNFKFDPNAVTSFTITVTDKAGNTGTYPITSYTKNGRLDTIAPQVVYATFNTAGKAYKSTTVTLSGKVADGTTRGNSTTNGYASSNKTYSDGSGLKTLYFYADSTCTKLLQKVDVDEADDDETDDDEADANSKYMTLSVSGTSSDFSVEIPYDTANSYWTGKVYIVAEDQVGNRSDGKNVGSSNDYAWTDAISSTFSTYASSHSGSSSSIYLYEGRFETGVMYRDTFTPQIIVKDGLGNILATSDESNLTGDGKSNMVYVFPWENTTKQTIYVDYYYGCSGATLYWGKSGEYSETKSSYSADTTNNRNYEFSSSSASGALTSSGTADSTWLNSRSSDGNSSYSVARASTGKQIVISDEGETSYTIYVKANAGQVSNTITIISRIDKSAPTVSLQGFYETIPSSASETPLYTESDLLQSSSWIKPGTSGLYAVYKVTDTASGLITKKGNGETTTTIPYGKVYGTATEALAKVTASKGSNAYNSADFSSVQYTSTLTKTYESISGVADAYQSDNTAGLHVEFKYDNGTDVYSYDKYDYVTYIDANTSYAVVKMFSQKDEYNSATLVGSKSGTAFKLKTVNGTNVYDVKTNTYLRYKIGVTDFIGNVGYANCTNQNRPNNDKGEAGDVEWGHRVIRYYVDPFSVLIESVAFYQKNSSEAVSDSDIYEKSITSIASTYEMNPNRNVVTAWANKYVIGEMKIYTSLSPYDIDYRYRDMTGQYDDYGNPLQDRLIYSKLPEREKATDESGGTIYQDVANKKAWFVFSNSETKDIQIAVAVVANNGSSATFAGTEPEDGFYIRQDTSNPVLESVFLSTEYNLSDAKNNKLLTFDASVSDNKYSFTLNTSQSPAYVAGKNFIYTAQKVYLYCIVNDKPGALEGSGVASVSYDGVSCTYLVKEGYSYYYKTVLTYGKSSISDEVYGIITVTDYQNNTITPTYGQKDVNDYYVFPIVDSTDPYVYLNTCNQTGYINLTTGDSDDSGKSVSLFKGDSIKNSTFYATLTWSGGISGVKFYVRKASNIPDDDVFTKNDKHFKCSGEYLPSNYDLSAGGWGYYDEYGTWHGYGTDGYDQTFYQVSYDSDETATGAKTGNINVLFYLKSFKDDVEILVVSGTGKYYIIKLGSLFIDTDSPIIHDGMTLFAVKPEDGGSTSQNYGDVQKIWEYVPTTSYTNGDVYVYYYITDSASGIDDSKVLQGDVVLDKVTLTNVPVWTVNGTKTTVRVDENVSTYTLDEEDGILTINGYKAYDLKNSEPITCSVPITNSSSYVIGKATADKITFYRYLAGEVGTVTITAKDIAQNDPKASTPYYIRIDKSGADVNITAVTDNNESYDGSVYTNCAVTMTWQGNFGASGFGGFDYTVIDKLKSDSKASYHIAIPHFENQNGYIVMNYVDTNGAYKSQNLEISWVDGFTVKVQLDQGSNKWVVNDANTGIVVNTEYYAGNNVDNLKSVAWKVYGSYVLCKVGVSKNRNANNEYTVTAYNGITDEYSVGKARPTASDTFSVKIDVIAPTIDTSSGTLAEILDDIANNRWHALAKAISANIYDDLSGIAKTSRLLGNERVEDIIISTESGNGGYLIKCTDGLYRAYYLTTDEGGNMVKDGLVYLDNYETYTITVRDEANNVATLNITPNIDSKKTTITSIKFYNSDGSVYDENVISVDWVKAIANNKINWAGDYVYAEIVVDYGRSGYILQNRRGATVSTISTGTWTNISTAAYTVKNTEDLGDGNYRDTIIYDIGRTTNSTYAYYVFRAISYAQNTELNVYKTKTAAGAEVSRATEETDNTYMSVTLGTFETDDARYANEPSKGYAKIMLGDKFYSGLIAIDKSQAEGTMALEKQDGLTDGGSAIYVSYGEKIDDNNWKIGLDEWSKEQVVITLDATSASNFASGNIIMYSSSYDGTEWTSWTIINPADGNIYTIDADGNYVSSGKPTNISFAIISSKHSDDSEVTMGYYTEQIKYTIKESTQNKMFRFRVVTGAGYETADYTFGTKEGGVVYGIKIDMVESTVQASGVSTFTIFDDTASQEVLGSEYNALLTTNTYMTNESATYTSKNTVVVRVMVQNVGYSGIKINLIEGTGDNKKIVTLDTISYDQYIEEQEKSTVYRYYYVSKNGATEQQLQIESIAGKTSTEHNVYIKIDNTTPIVYVTGISGTKATNWGWTDENLYTSLAEYWYTSEVTVEFGIGVIENGVFDDQSPYSLYTLEYNVNGGDDWVPLNEDRIKFGGSNIIENASYKFRIRSGAGMIYTLGTTVLDNQGRATYDTSALNGDITSVAKTTPITAHVAYDGTGDYDDGSYYYIFNVDSTVYYCNYTGKVDLGTYTGEDRNYDTRTGTFVDYWLEVADKDGNFSSAGENPTFKRGDVIRLSYEAYYNEVSSGASHNYFHNITVSSAGDRVYGYNMTETPIGMVQEDYVMFERGGVSGKTAKELEQGGYVTLQFESSTIKVVSYFIAEVDVKYGQDKFYLQVEDAPYQTTGTATYDYGKANETLGITLSYEYREYFTGEQIVPTAVGAYYVNTSVTQGTGSFRVTDSTASKDFIIKYYDDSNDDYATNGTYYINNETDFTYVDVSYYDLGDDGNVIETVKTYLDSNFTVTSDLTTDYTVSGDYKGAFDGQDHSITLAVRTISDDYGLFERILGSVQNLNVKVNNDVVIIANDVAYVGLLAKELASSGKIQDVTVVADVEIKKMASGSVFGGVVAISDGGQIGGTGSVFTDVRITNSGKALSGVSVGGVVGSMDVGTVLSGIYAFGEVELYNVDDTVKAGILYGSATSGTYSVYGVSYFDNNTFINASTVSGVSNATNAITFSGTISEEEYATFVELPKTETVGGVSISGEILGRLYSDFGYQYGGTEPYGIGTNDNPLVISTIDHIRAINGYMNLNFVFDNTVSSIDMSGYDESIAVTKVFNGSLSTKNGATGTRYVTLSDFAGDLTTYDQEYFGLFGQLNGIVSNILFGDLAVDFDYVGEKDLVAGLVSAKAYENAVISNVIIIGSETVRADGKTANVGGVVGYARGSEIYDIFSVNNVSLTANKVVMGQISAIAENITLPSTDGSIFLLGRVEGYGTSMTVGSAIGQIVDGTTINGGAKVFTILSNVYIGGEPQTVKPIGCNNETYGINTVSFANETMRNAGFKSMSGTAFKLVFNGLYPLKGDGSSNTPFEITSEKDFNYINLALYAEYRIDGDITFRDFQTIGEGLVFSGVLRGSTGDDISAEEGKIVSLNNVTGPLVYYNSGKINDLSINVVVSKKVKAGETYYYGAVAVKSDGEIKNVIVAGTVNITSDTQDTTIYASGFVAISLGGAIDVETSKLQNSISAITINVNGGGTAYVGGYAGMVSMGSPKFSYGIATGTINVNDVKTTHAGLLVGMSHGECQWVLGEAASIDYTYTIVIDGKEIPKYDENDEPLVSNFCGLTFVNQD